MHFFENKVSWHLVYEDGAYSLYFNVYRYICLKIFLVIDNEVHR